MTKPWLVAGAILLVASVWALQYSATQLPPRGMRAAIYRGADFSGAPAMIVDDVALDPVLSARQAGLNPGEPFSIEWNGTAVITESGNYRLRAFADDGVTLWIDDRVIVENIAPGQHDLVGQVNLAEGLHAVRIRYVQFTGDAGFRLTWMRAGPEHDFSGVPIVLPRSELVFRRLAKATQFPLYVAISWSAWILWGLAIAACATVKTLNGGTRALPRGRTAVLMAMVAIPLLAYAVHIGVAPWRGWGSDELHTEHLLAAARNWFANGWSDLYPPLHFYLLNIVILPFVLLDGWGALSVDSFSTQAVIHAVARVVTVVMALLTLLVTAVIAETTIGRRRGLAAAAFLLSVPAFVFYAKTTNVDMPYVFWLSLALLLLLRAVRTRAIRDHAWLGAVAACAVATKDQAYGFFPGAALVVAWFAWLDTDAERPWPKRVMAVARDKRLWAGLGTCVCVYVLLMGVVWNFEGVRNHFAFLIGDASQPYRMVPATATGIASLLAATLKIASATLGPIVLAFAIVGVVVAVSNAERYRDLFLLLAPIATYFVTFVAVVGYVYDRFLLVPALVAALFAALGFDVAMRGIGNRSVRVVAALAVFAIALLPSTVLNWRIAHDSRLEAERWMSSLPDPFVLAVGPREYLPNLHPFRHEQTVETSPRALVRWNADVVVVYEPWLARRDAQAAAESVSALEDAGYARAFTGPPPSGWLTRLAGLGRSLDPIYSNLEKVAPPLSIWQRSVH